MSPTIPDLEVGQSISCVSTDFTHPQPPQNSTDQCGWEASAENALLSRSDLGWEARTKSIYVAVHEHTFISRVVP